jgi:hypothetical protein
VPLQVGHVVLSALVGAVTLRLVFFFVFGAVMRRQTALFTPTLAGDIK